MKNGVTTTADKDQGEEECGFYVWVRARWAAISVAG